MPDQGDEGTGSTAALTRVESYYIGKYPVTWRQYRAFCQAARVGRGG